MKKLKQIVTAIVVSVALCLSPIVPTFAAEEVHYSNLADLKYMDDGTLFDPLYYANENPNAIKYKEVGVEKMLLDEEEKLFSGAPNLIELQDSEGIKFTKSADFQVKEQSLLSWCRNDGRKKAKKGGKAGWLPK